MKKHFFTRVFVAIAVFSLLGLTINLGAVDFKGKTLYIMAASDEFITNKVVEDFEKRTRAKVELQIVPNEQYMSKLKPVLKAGKKVPDIFIGEAGYVKEVVNLGVLSCDKYGSCVR